MLSKALLQTAASLTDSLCAAHASRRNRSRLMRTCHVSSISPCCLRLCFCLRLKPVLLSGFWTSPPQRFCPFIVPFPSYITNPSLLVHFPQQFAKTRLVMPRGSLGSLISWDTRGRRRALRQLAHDVFQGKDQHLAGVGPAVRPAFQSQHPHLLAFSPAQQRLQPL